MSARRKAEATSPLSFIGTCVSYVALCLAALAALILVVIPMATGSQTYSVLTSSMAPKYAPGTFLVVKPIPFNELSVGDIITYQIDSGAPAVISHRITSVSTEQSGETVYTTKGDNNDVDDALPVRQVQIKGKLFYAVPYVGFVANSLGNSDRGAMAQWGAVALMGYGVVALVRGALAKKRNEGESDEGSRGNDNHPFVFPDFGPAEGDGNEPRHDDPILTDCDGCDHDKLRGDRNNHVHRLEARKHATVS